MKKFKEFLLELVNDFLAYWLPHLIASGMLLYKGNVFTLEQRDLIFAIMCVFTYWRLWDGKDKDYQIKELQEKVHKLESIAFAQFLRHFNLTDSNK